MPTFQIKTYNKRNTIREHSFFTLSRGFNVGKPSHQPYANSFVISAPNAEEMEFLYWLTYGLWQAKAFHPFLTGSVIPFIHIRDFKTVVTKQVILNKEKQGKTIKTMQLLEQQEKAYMKRLALIKEAKAAILYRCLKG